MIWGTMPLYLFCAHAFKNTSAQFQFFSVANGEHTLKFNCVFQIVLWIPLIYGQQMPNHKIHQGTSYCRQPYTPCDFNNILLNYSCLMVFVILTEFSNITCSVQLPGAGILTWKFLKWIMWTSIVNLVPLPVRPITKLYNCKILIKK